MSEHLTSKRIARYLSHRLPKKDIRKVRLHVQECKKCKKTLAARMADRLLKMKVEPSQLYDPSLKRSSSCPQDYKLLSYISRDLPKKEIEYIEKHIVKCEYCISLLSLFGTLLSQKEKKILYPPSKKSPTPLMVREEQARYGGRSHWDAIMKYGKFINWAVTIINERLITQNQSASLIPMHGQIKPEPIRSETPALYRKFNAAIFTGRIQLFISDMQHKIIEGYFWLKTNQRPKRMQAVVIGRFLKGEESISLKK